MSGINDLPTDLVVRQHGRGPAEAPILVLLHGLTDSGLGWPGAVRHWSADYAILAVDQRGHGESPRFTAEQLEGRPGQVMVEDLLRILERLPRFPVVVGHSLGGAVALDAAARRPELFRGILLEDPAPLGPDDPEVDRAKGERFFGDVQASVNARDDADLLEVRRGKHPDWAEDELLASGVGEQQVDLDYLRSGSFKPSSRWPNLFATLTTPTLVVSGDDLDEVCMTKEVEAGLEHINNPHVTFRRVSGAAHCVRREQPDAFYALTDDWLTNLPVEMEG